MTNPVVFMVGCPRSGTTLFRHIVDAHHEIAITPEAHWIFRWFKERTCLTTDGMITDQFVSQLLAEPKFALFRIERENLAELARSGEPISYARFVTRIFDLYGKLRGKQRVGNKTPDAVRKIHLLHTLWPEAHFIHLIRDGRDVALSLMNWSRVQEKRPGTFSTWKDDPVSTSALWWELHVRCGRDAARLLPPGLYREFRYEALVANPRRECEKLCRILGLPFDEAMLHFHEKRKNNALGETQREWQPITAGMRDWRSQMSVGEVEKFEAAAGGLLDELGYARNFPQPRPEVVEQSSLVRNALARYQPGVTRAREALGSSRTET